MYVIRRKNDGLYVTKPGSKTSYTTKLENARPYNTEEEADKAALSHRFGKALKITHSALQYD